jgi:hypothetical protein
VELPSNKLADLGACYSAFPESNRPASVAEPPANPSAGSALAAIALTTASFATRGVHVLELVRTLDLYRLTATEAVTP